MLDPQSDSAVQLGVASIPLLIIVVLGLIVEDQLPCAGIIGTPVAGQCAVLLPVAACFSLVGEVGVDVKFEREGGWALRKVSEVDVLVYAIADVAREPQLQRLLAGFGNLSTALIWFARVKIGRKFRRM